MQISVETINHIAFAYGIAFAYSRGGTGHGENMKSAMEEIFRLLDAANDELKFFPSYGEIR